MPKAKTAALRIAIVDDHVMVRTYLTDHCNAWAHGKVVLCATDGVDYEEQMPTAGPVDLAIVDLSMPRRDGYETIAWIREYQPAVRTLAITFDPDDHAVYHALQAGAHGVVGKSISPVDLHSALDALRTTGYHATAALMRQLTHAPDPNSPLALRKKLRETLGPRETEFLLHYVADESPSRNQVGERMNIKPGTAETYRRNIAEKTGAPSRLAMLRMAIRFGLVKV